jgi:hypothetical protein
MSCEIQHPFHHNVKKDNSSDIGDKTCYYILIYMIDFDWIKLVM